MLLYFAFGILVLALGLLLLRAFVQANPAKLARGTRIALIAAAASIALIVLVLLFASERLGLGFAEIGALVPILLRGYTLWRRRQAQKAPSPGKTSEVETDYLRMHLDHDTGTMSGTVRRGRFKGCTLTELSRDELIELWRECRAEDAQGAKLVEAYLDRLAPDWREAGAARADAASDTAEPMTREEALQILGLAAGAGEAEIGEAQIREAYERLMRKIRPDGGSGSAYLAAELDRARKILLG